MSPFDVVIPQIAESELSRTLNQLAGLGLPAPTVLPSSVAPGQPWPRVPIDEPGEELPGAWQLVAEREGETYKWPDYLETYKNYTLYLGTFVDRDPVMIGLGETKRTNKWGRDRRYVVAFLSNGAPQQPLVEFIEADDFKTTREFLAIIRGSDGGRRMFGPGDQLPEAYELHFRVELYSDRVHYRGVWNKMVVVAREDDHNTMLNHAVLQARRRYGIR